MTPNSELVGTVFDLNGGSGLMLIRQLDVDTLVHEREMGGCIEPFRGKKDAATSGHGGEQSWT